MDFFIKSSVENLSQRKLESLYKLGQILQWGRSAPVKFSERFMGIEYLDVQKYTFMNSWIKPNNLWCYTRNGSKSTLVAPFIMCKGILINGHFTYILSNVSSQTQETFMKIEKIAKKEIQSFTGLTDFFIGELITNNSNTDGFTHSQSGFKYQLFNGSQTMSLSGEIDTNRGKRSNLNVYDESGWTSEEYISATTPFLTQNSSFKLGGNLDATSLPRQIPNQRLFMSSASSTDTPFFGLYKDYAMQMLIGNPDYFVIDVNCEVMFNPSVNGKIYPVEFLSRETVEAEIRKNKDKAMREFYNKFSVDGGDNQVFKRALIHRNTEIRLPVIKNESSDKRRFAIAYDPAHESDNSVCLIGELIEDANVGMTMRIVNGVSLVDVAKKKKTPMRTPEQIKEVKGLILDYNGVQKADYENIECLLIDAGAGGHGTTIADYLMEDWTDDKGVKHKGLIDKVECAEHSSKFPNAVDKLKLMSPQKYKTEMFDGLLEMLKLDLISFTGEYDLSGFLNVAKPTGKKIIVEKEDDNGKIIKVEEDEITIKRVKLDFEEEMALKQIDLTKEEIVYMYRNKGANGNHRYELSKEKESTMNDDRAYCLAMLGWYLVQVRRTHITKRKIDNNFDNAKHFATALKIN